MNDVEPDVQRFLDYVNGIISNDEFVQEIDQTIRKEKADKKKGMDYMTYEMKIKEERKEERNLLVLNGLRQKVPLKILEGIFNLSETQIRKLASENNLPVNEG